MEIFNHRFYKNLDDSLPVGDMSDNDRIACFELPCHAQQSRTYQKRPGDPFITPVYLCDAKPPLLRSNYFNSTRGAPNLFGYPMVIAIDHEQAKDPNAMYEAVIVRLQRWTAHARDLFAWEAGEGSPIEEVPIQINGFPPIESITEFTEDGKVVTVQAELAPELEGAIVDEKRMIVDEDFLLSDGLRMLGPKKNVFNLRLQSDHKDLGTAYNAYITNNRWESWDSRLREADTNPILLREDDAFYCEFDENVQAYYFGDGPRHEHALWEHWEIFTHPEYEEGKKAAAEKHIKGISLQDCLDEFTKEEMLGEDDLWYCPDCKKHQQATKKFDLWKAPDILVVHLKRFSNSRTLRDKIDALIEFPIEGLDLSEMVGERAVARRLFDQGVDIEELKLDNLDEPLVYDLFGVDEHIGGLGGGHYRAYTSNHLTNKWYHFDDSYVTTAQASDSVV
jgi:ubiquitin carboxyl-terminal hydrolase 4/11/15